jgi:hypothetical protein
MTAASDALVTSVVHIFLLHSESAASSLREHYGICAFVADPAWSEVVEAASRLVEFCRKAKADLQQCRFEAVCLLAIALAEESLRYAVREAKHPAHKDRRVFRALGNFSRHCAQYAADAAGSRRNGHVDEANDWETVAHAGMAITGGPLPQCEGIEHDMVHSSNAVPMTASCQDSACRRIWERAIRAEEDSARHQNLSVFCKHFETLGGNLKVLRAHYDDQVLRERSKHDVLALAARHLEDAQRYWRDGNNVQNAILSLASKIGEDICSKPLTPQAITAPLPQIVLLSQLSTSCAAVQASYAAFGQSRSIMDSVAFNQGVHELCVLVEAEALRIFDRVTNLGVQPLVGDYLPAVTLEARLLLDQLQRVQHLFQEVGAVPHYCRAMRACRHNAEQARKCGVTPATDCITRCWDAALVHVEAFLSTLCEAFSTGGTTGGDTDLQLKAIQYSQLASGIYAEADSYFRYAAKAMQCISGPNTAAVAEYWERAASELLAAGMKAEVALADGSTLRVTQLPSDIQQYVAVAARWKLLAELAASGRTMDTQDVLLSLQAAHHAAAVAPRAPLDSAALSAHCIILGALDTLADDHARGVQRTLGGWAHRLFTETTQLALSSSRQLTEQAHYPESTDTTARTEQALLSCYTCFPDISATAVTGNAVLLDASLHLLAAVAHSAAARASEQQLTAVYTLLSHTARTLSLRADDEYEDKAHEVDVYNFHVAVVEHVAQYAETFGVPTLTAGVRALCKHSCT